MLEYSLTKKKMEGTEAPVAFMNFDQPGSNYSYNESVLYTPTTQPDCYNASSNATNDFNLTPCEAVCSGGNGSACNVTSGYPEGENPFILPWYLQAVYILAFVSMVIVAAGGNLIVIWIVVAHKRMRTVTNYFLVNLAAADALISILNTLFNFVYMLYSHWPFGRTYCKFTQFIAPCTISASVFTFMAIAIDRYMAIIHPLKPRMSAGIILSIIAVIWMTSVLVAFPSLLFADVHTWHFAGGKYRIICYLAWPDGAYNSVDLAYNLFLMMVNYVAPLIALAVTYTRVGLELWGSQAIGERTPRQEETVKSKRRVVKMMIIVVIIFGVCWLPQHVFFLVSNQHKDPHDYIQHIYLVIYWLAMSNSMYNPIIFCWMNAKFRHGFQHVFRWLPCVTVSVTETKHRPVGVSTRMSMSVSETTKYGGYERNGSMMHTVIETLEESSYAPTTAMITPHKSFPTLREEEESEDAL